MKKIYITGGDNCYCGECGGLCDRHIMLVDTVEKTIEYLPMVFGETCLGQFCTSRILLADEWADWVIERITFGGKKWIAKNTQTGETMPVIVKNSKWGKDGEYGTIGCTWGGEKTETDGYVAYALTNRGDGSTPTGWTLIYRKEVPTETKEEDWNPNFKYNPYGMEPSLEEIVAETANDKLVYSDDLL